MTHYTIALLLIPSIALILAVVSRRFKLAAVMAALLAVQCAVTYLIGRM